MIKRIEWLITGRMILVEIADVISADDVDNISEKVSHMIATEGEPPYVHVLYDVRQRSAISPEILSLSRLRLSSKPASIGMLGWTLIVDPNPHVIMQSLASILIQVMSIRLRVFKEMQAALDFIWDMDKTLPGPQNEPI